MSPSKDPQNFYGYLFDPSKQPTKLLDALLRGIAHYIIHNIGDVTDNYLKPDKMAAFYKAVGGNYDSLFVNVPNESISWIYASIGCQHLLLPTNDHFMPPSIPSLTVAGFVRWQSLEILLGPEEHVPFIQKSLRLFDIRHPDTNKPFPKDLHNDSFPSKPDPEIHRWHRKCAQKLRRCAINAANEIPDSPPKTRKSSGHSRPRPHEIIVEQPTRSHRSKREHLTRDSHLRDLKRRSKSADDGNELGEDSPRNLETSRSKSTSSHSRGHVAHYSYYKERPQKKNSPDDLLFFHPTRHSVSPDRHRRSNRRESAHDDYATQSQFPKRSSYNRAKSYEPELYAKKDQEWQKRCQHGDRTENLRWRDLDPIAAVLKSRRDDFDDEKAGFLKRGDKDRGRRREWKWEPDLDNTPNPRDVGKRQSSYEILSRRERYANQINESRRRSFRVTDTGNKYFGFERIFNIRNLSPVSTIDGRRPSDDD